MLACGVSTTCAVTTRAPHSTLNRTVEPLPDSAEQAAAYPIAAVLDSTALFSTRPLQWRSPRFVLALPGCVELSD